VSHWVLRTDARTVTVVGSVFTLDCGELYSLGAPVIAYKQTHQFSPKLVMEDFLLLGRDSVLR
jgi:hypothetical protein